MAKKRLIITLCVLIAVLGAIFLPGYSKLQRLRARNRHLKEKLRTLEAENERLQKEAEQLRKDPYFIEKKAREKMGIVKEGEIIYRIVSEEEKE